MKFNSLLKSLIVEQGRYEILVDMLTKPKQTKDGKKIQPLLSKEQLDTIVETDPTSRSENGVITKAGTYVNWIVTQFKKLAEDLLKQEYFNEDPIETMKSKSFQKELENKKEVFLEDLYKVNDALTKFNHFKDKSKLENGKRVPYIPKEFKDITKINIRKLYQLTQDLSLELATTTKAERKSSLSHPGSSKVYEGENWVVYKIEGTGDIQKEAACFYGGNALGSVKGETTWCTSGPGLEWWRRYLSKGPLYVNIDKTDTETGEVSGLPRHRYQFHFQEKQFMDVNDDQIDLVKFFNETAPDLKEFYRSEFIKGLGGNYGKDVQVDYPRDSASQYIAIYGLDEFFKNLPKDLTRLDFEVSGKGKGEFKLQLPKEIGNFDDLIAIHIDSVLSEIPEDICKLSKLRFLSLPNSLYLKSLPECLADIDSLQVINLMGSDGNIQIPEKLKEKHLDPKSKFRIVTNQPL